MLNVMMMMMMMMMMKVIIEHSVVLNINNDVLISHSTTNTQSIKLSQSLVVVVLCVDAVAAAQLGFDIDDLTTR